MHLLLMSDDFLGLHVDALHDAILAGLATRLHRLRGRQHDPVGRLCRQDLGAGHLLRQRHGVVPTRRYRAQQDDPHVRRRLRRLRAEVHSRFALQLYIIIKLCRNKMQNRTLYLTPTINPA